jgi:hypothetical protein
MYLSQGDMITLIKSTFLNFSTYFMYPSPYGCCKPYREVSMRFLMGVLGKEFKFHFVSWSKVCSSISNGGLGVWNLLMFNRGLLRKWLWRYVYETKAWC